MCGKLKLRELDSLEEMGYEMALRAVKQPVGNKLYSGVLTVILGS